MASSLRLVPDSGSAVVVEHRFAPRLLASQMPSITGLRLSPHGADASLVNISVNGVLAECTVRLKTGSAVTILFEGDFTPASVASRVTRCAVSAMGGDGLLRYHIGIAFNAPITLEGAPSGAEQPSAVESDPPADATTPGPALLRNRW
jgi:hypothetical protein